MSRDGPRPSVRRESRDDTAAGGIGGMFSAGGWLLAGGRGCNNERSCCCDGSKCDGSICDGDVCGVEGNVSGFGLIRGTDGGRRRAFRDCRSFCNRCICSSSSRIFSVFCTFFGCGFFTTTAGGASSSRPNQLDRSEFDSKSLSSSSWITRAANRALWSSDRDPDGLFPIARVAHQIKSCRIRRGSGKSGAICL